MLSAASAADLLREWERHRSLADAEPAPPDSADVSEPSGKASGSSGVGESTGEKSASGAGEVVIEMPEGEVAGGVTRGAGKLCVTNSVLHRITLSTKV